MTKKVWITAYDIFSARIAESANVDAILIGDSLGMTVYGMENTKTVTREMMLAHFLAVKKKVSFTRIVLDAPFGSDENVLKALDTAEFFASHGAKEMKWEISEENFSVLLELRSRGFECTAHLGLLPQKIEYWKVQGKTEEEAEKIFSLAKKCDALGVKSIVLECIPEDLAKKITENVKAETIGIGAGRFTNGQVLVFDDVVGKSEKNFSPKFLRRFGDAENECSLAVQKFVHAVKEQNFPNEKEVY